MKPPEQWSAAEQFVWEKTHAGEEADFNKLEDKDLDPKSSDGWDSRRISSEFLETILFEKPFREEVTRKGVRIIGAYFSDEIDLEDGHLPWVLGLQYSRFENRLNIRGLRTDRQVSLDGSVVKGELNLGAASIGNSLFMRKATFEEAMLRGAQITGQLSMIDTTVKGALDMASISVDNDLLMGGATFAQVMLRGAQITGQLSMIGTTVKGTLDTASASVGGALLMAEGATFKKVMLRGAQITGQLAMREATVTDTLDMASASVGGALLMDRATFAQVMFRGASVGDQLSLIDARIKGKLDMDSVSVGSALLMRATVFEEVILRGAQITGQLAIRDATVTGRLDMTSASVGDSLLMDGTTFADVALGFAMIGSMLNLTGGTFRALNLTGATVEGELRLITDNKSINWLPDSKDQSNEIQLNLQNTQVGTLVDSPKSWPKKIELRGFTYRQLGGAEQKDEPSEQLAPDFIKWLGRSKTFSFQPYQQLATVLRAAGKSGTADAVLFAGKERERKNAKGWEKAWLNVLWFVIGYGIGRYTFLALGWAIFVVIVGWSVLICSGESQKHEKTVTVGEERTVGKIGFWFSLDYLLPAVRLREAHYTKVGLSCGVRIYFYVHQLIGYILVFFLIAALTGITNPSNGRGPPG